MGDRPHDRILRDIGRDLLGPIGVEQKGRSRTWIDDRVWYLTRIEFQPSSWSQGAYLNVGINWLWNPKADASFDLGYRVMDFQVADNNWETKARRLVEKAADEVRRYRATVPTPAAAAALLANESGDGWPLFHRAIAHGLAGNVEAADQDFARLIAAHPEDRRDRVLEMRERARILRAKARSTALFREHIVGEIENGRALLKRPPTPRSAIAAALGFAVRATLPDAD
jgi:hypothetical protein